MIISTCVYHLAPATLRYLPDLESTHCGDYCPYLREDLADATKIILNTLLMSPVHMLQCYDASDIHVHQMQCAWIETASDDLRLREERSSGYGTTQTSSSHMQLSVA